MPIFIGTDNIGPFYRYGKSGKKYHFMHGNHISQTRAYNNALIQMRAIKASQSRRKYK